MLTHDRAMRPRLTSEQASRLWYIRAARSQHRKLRAAGRELGAEGRAVIEANRARRREAKLNAANGINVGTPSANVKLPPPSRG